MAGAEGMVSLSQINSSVNKIRFDRAITSFKFTPSLGIVAKQLAALGDEFTDLREPLQKAVDDVMTKSIAQNFMQGGRPDAWDELTYYTVKRRKGSATPILVRTGALAKVGSSAKIWSVGRQTAAIRDIPDSVWYGKVHQAGSEGDDSTAAGSWLEKYKKKAKEIEGPEATEKEILNTAYKIFDMRTAKHGIAPQSQADIPQRQWALFQEQDIDDIQNIFIDWIEEKLRTVGRFS